VRLRECRNGRIRSGRAYQSCIGQEKGPFASLSEEGLDTISSHLSASQTSSSVTPQPAGDDVMRRNDV
jgi:hypothetical protein